MRPASVLRPTLSHRGPRSQVGPARSELSGAVPRRWLVVGIYAALTGLTALLRLGRITNRPFGWNLLTLGLIVVGVGFVRLMFAPG